MDDAEAREQVARVETLLEEVEALADPPARDKATELAGALLDLYGEGLDRIVAQVAERDADGELADALAGDELVAHLLLVHDLHPVPIEERVEGALREVRPYLESHGGNVTYLGVEDGIVRLRLEGSCSGCPSSAMTLKLAVEEAIRKAAPDILEIEAEGTIETVPAPAAPLQIESVPAPSAAPTAAPTSGPGLIQLEMVGGAGAPPVAERSEPQPTWSMAGGIREVPGGGPMLRRVSGEEVLFVKLGEDVYAYRPTCPECQESLEQAEVEDDELICAGCAQRYEVRRAGRCSSGADAHLEPVPLLIDESGLVKVALGSVAA